MTLPHGQAGAVQPAEEPGRGGGRHRRRHQRRAGAQGGRRRQGLTLGNIMNTF
jgi:hypothetical protein